MGGLTYGNCRGFGSLLAERSTREYLVGESMLVDERSPSNPPRTEEQTYQGYEAQLVIPKNPPGFSKEQQVATAPNGRKKMIALAKICVNDSLGSCMFCGRYPH